MAYYEKTLPHTTHEPLCRSPCMCIGKVQSALSEQDNIRGRPKCGGRYDRARHLDAFSQSAAPIYYNLLLYYAKLGR